MRELSSFLQDTAHGLSNKVTDGDYAGLVDIMGHLMAIRDRQISNEQHFKPLKSTAELLKSYGQQLPESVYTQLEVCTNAQLHTFPIKNIYLCITFFILSPQKHRSCQRSGRAWGKLHSQLNMKWHRYNQMKFQLYAGNVSGLRWDCVSGVEYQQWNLLQRAQYLTYKPSHFFICFFLSQFRSSSMSSENSFVLNQSLRWMWSCHMN